MQHFQSYSNIQYAFILGAESIPDGIPIQLGTEDNMYDLKLKAAS